MNIERLEQLILQTETEVDARPDYEEGSEWIRQVTGLDFDDLVKVIARICSSYLVEDSEMTFMKLVSMCTSTFVLGVKVGREVNDG